MTDTIRRSWSGFGPNSALVSNIFGASMSESARLATLTAAELTAAIQATPRLHDHQAPPVGDWRTWVILGGRGSGKTFA